MKYIIVIILLLTLLIGCSSLREKGETYKGYSCRESIMHFYSRCHNKNISKEEYEVKVKECEKEMASEACDTELAGLLWCMGRVEPGQYSQGGAVCSGWVCFGSGNTKDGCDCSAWAGSLKECRMKNGIFDEKK